LRYAANHATFSIMEMDRDEFKKLMARLRLSQTDLAQRLYVDRTTVNRWAMGTRRVPGPVVAYLKLLKYVRDRDEESTV
jgi:DNA-binding transcriptional regulator YiaG